MQLSFQSGVHCNIPDNNKEAETWIQVCRRLARGCHSLNWVPGKSWESQGGWLTILPIECWLTYKHMPYAQYTYGTAESFTCFFFIHKRSCDEVAILRDSYRNWWEREHQDQLQNCCPVEILKLPIDDNRMRDHLFSMRDENYWWVQMWREQNERQTFVSRISKIVKKRENMFVLHQLHYRTN